MRQEIPTVSMRTFWNCGVSMRQATPKPMISRIVYMARVLLDSLMGGQQEQHSVPGDGPHKQATCNIKIILKI